SPLPQIGGEGSNLPPSPQRGEGSNLPPSPRWGEGSGVRGRRIGTETNRHGGMLGGISSGEPIVLRVGIKPTSSLPRPQRTVTRAGEPTEIVTRGRHDPCLLPRFVPMGEAMVALVLADHWLRWRAQCGDVRAAGPLTAAETS